mmetsp:Transcript_6842/g.19995  ORF Transcript_6842/g.19995 Transcript_6842/m.19995 type:complete len:212 (-) Transcript_6842:128-763(-)
MTLSLICSSESSPLGPKRIFFTFSPWQLHWTNSWDATKSSLSSVSAKMASSTSIFSDRPYWNQFCFCGIVGLTRTSLLNRSSRRSLWPRSLYAMHDECSYATRLASYMLNLVRTLKICLPSLLHNAWDENSLMKSPRRREKSTTYTRLAPVLEKKASAQSSHFSFTVRYCGVEDASGSSGSGKSLSRDIHSNTVAFSALTLGFSSSCWDKQ